MDKNSAESVKITSFPWDFDTFIRCSGCLSPIDGNRVPLVAVFFLS